MTLNHGPWFSVPPVCYRTPGTWSDFFNGKNMDRTNNFPGPVRATMFMTKVWPKPFGFQNFGIEKDKSDFSEWIMIWWVINSEEWLHLDFSHPRQRRSLLKKVSKRKIKVFGNSEKIWLRDLNPRNVYYHDS